ncbi:MAG: hydantoinase B/oxoprolinase family protein [Heliobacteriaceae bacterium]|nr:hydantoinase B/oxoprolinase family protein [Heliobacteriaceae bacterium]
MDQQQRAGQQPSGWAFWIDTGGTFTDCLARRPDGAILTYKLLSSGVIKGKVATGSSRTVVRDPARWQDPHDFFAGFRLNLLASGEQGPVTCLDSGVPVKAFEQQTGRLFFARPLAVEPAAGMTYELFSGEEAPVTGIRWLLGRRLDQPVGAVEVRLGTTLGTNALLERRGAVTALVTTAGFGDGLRIGYQNRPRLFDLNIQKPRDLYTLVVELPERTGSQGEVLVPLDPGIVRERLAPLIARGIRALAVCLLNAYKNPAHEQVVKKAAGELGFPQVSLSSELVPLPGLIARGETTVVDAYLTPVIRDYVTRIRSQLPEAALKLMTSAGGLVDPNGFTGKECILSGPAGGVVAYSRVAREAGCLPVIGFDMGGTSTDVSRFGGEFEYRFGMAVSDPETGGQLRVVAPMLHVETVAAGGGSVCWFDGQLPRVGPQSAGAVPGPACYGRGGPLTITDVNLFLGRIQAALFPFPLHLGAVAARLDELGEQMAGAGQSYSREELAAGFLLLANNRIAAAIKKISLARGFDVRDHTLAGFGGAGGQHVCAVARELDIKTILLHPYAGILSAYGIGLADVVKFAEHPVGRPLNHRELQRLEPVLARMAAGLYQAVRAEGVPPERIRPARRLLELRYTGQDWTLQVPEPADGDYLTAFTEQHRLHYGFTYPGRQVEIHAARVEVTGVTEKPSRLPVAGQAYAPEPVTQARAYFAGSWRETPVYRREDLRPGARVTGPAIIVEPTGTVVIEPGWSGELTGDLNLLVRTDRLPAAAGAGPVNREVDLITLELFNHTLASVAEQMGVTLQKTASSTNVKERLDFSCAVFTADGELVVNAPHIPVHLGAMAATVKNVLSVYPKMRPGEAYVTNDPFGGGSHLPDVTVVTPVFGGSGDDAERLFFTASRAHHAEIGGMTPGSMPPRARTLAEEGVLIRPFKLIAANQASEDELGRLLSTGPYPSRAVADNLADIRAQAAANQTGAALLHGLVARYGPATVKAYMDYIRQAARRMMETALLKIKPGEYAFRDYLDDGSPLAVKITIYHRAGGRGEAVVDFQGTGPVVAGNLNANRAIVTSAVLYCFRCLITEDIPLNAGMLVPLTILLPPGCFLNPVPHPDPSRCAAVAGGNVETAQRVVDVIFGALKVVAASQGTMNNFLFGQAPANGRPGFGYYETIGGGAGAGPDFSGANAVHTHMTNTRLTDPEILEARYPVRLRRFTVRSGSGGAGRWRGGDGIIREVEFLAPVEVSLLTGRRRYAPYGLAGGQPGAKGRNRLQRAGSRPAELDWAATFTAGPGDILTIETPGGGGYGK